MTIRNLVIRNMPQRGIHAYYWMSDHWTIEYNEIASNKNVGIVFPGYSTIRNNYIHHNTYGGYMGPYAHNTTLESNEIAYNGTQQKVSESANVTFRNNFVHHNAGAGIWYDSDNTGALIEGNRVEDNGSHRDLLRDQQRRHHPEQHHPAERGYRGVHLHVQERADLQQHARKQFPGDHLLRQLPLGWRRCDQL